MNEMKRPIAHIIVGFIGAGKTTFAKKLEAETGAVRFTKDEWMVKIFGNNSPSDDKFSEYDGKMAVLSREMAFRCLKAGTSVIMDEGFWEKELREQIKNRVLSMGAIPKMYYLEVPFEVMKARTVMRSENPNPDSFVISEEQFNHYWKFFQPPSENEEFTVIKQ